MKNRKLTDMKKIIYLVAVTALVVASCTPKAQEVAEQKVLQVKVEQAKIQKVNQVIDFTGNIEPFVKNSISSSSAQRIEKIYTEVGSRVAKGQLLVQMENPAYIQAKIQIQSLKIDLARIESLYKAGGASQQQYDQVKTQYDVAVEGLSNLDKNTKLLSPISGVVTQRNFDNGDLTMGQPILTVMQLQPVKIIVNISEEFYPLAKLGTQVQIMLDIYQGKVFNGKISLVYPTIDPVTRTFSVQVSIPNGDLKLRPGMFARARVNFGAKDRVVVPDKAIIKQSGTNDRFVYILDGDVVLYKKVVLGKRVDSVYEVLSGVEAGEKVVVAGQSKLADKAKVEVVASGVDLSL
jgi:RND family efflux transporter MFP subunit